MNLTRLTALEPDPDRAERVRARCRAQLDRGRRRKAQISGISEFSWQVLGPAVLGAFSVLYATALTVTTIGLQALFR